MELEAKLDLSKVVVSSNVAEMLSGEDLKSIGECVVNDWQVDKNSRYEWEEKTANALKLATQVMEEKTFPWAGASNVKFPLVTIAALQYSSRAYPALVPSTNVVRARVLGQDPDGAKVARAQRIQDFMSYQVLEEDECWEEQTDKALISQAIVGCAFKKTFFDAVEKKVISEHILAKDLYIPYFATSLEKASRITHLLYYSKNKVIECMRRGIFLDYEEDEEVVEEVPMPEVSVLTEVQDESQGMNYSPTPDSMAPVELLEQHRYLDLDGDGYQEPYVVTVQKSNGRVLRIVARFYSNGIERNKKKEILRIKEINCFTKYPFIPSPDGGIYDLGFGVLLGPLNESINTILNQLIDSGTLSVTAGGFLGRGVKFRSGDTSFRPFEWKRVDSTGDDLQKSIFPLPVREPSPVLFQLLDLLINYGERIGMAVDPLVGENPGQNTPAETSRNMIAEGQRIFGAVFKRTYRALKNEFRKIYTLNGLYLNDEQTFYSMITGTSGKVLQEDFLGDAKDVVPAADPNMITDEARLQQVLLLKQSSDVSPGYNKYEVEKRFLQALKIEDIESVLPDPSGPNAVPKPQADPKVIVESMKLEQKNKEFDMQMQLKILDLQQEAAYLQAEIAEKESRATLNLAQAEGVEAGHQLAALQQSVALMKQKQDSVLQTLGILRDLQKLYLEKRKLDEAGNGGGVQSTSSESGV